MSNILTKNKMNGIKKIDSNCKNVLPHTKMAGRDKNDRTNSRTFCQQNRIAFSLTNVRQDKIRQARYRKSSDPLTHQRKYRSKYRTSSVRYPSQQKHTQWNNEESEKQP
jgi:hypothetical protein